MESKIIEWKTRAYFHSETKIEKPLESLKQPNLAVLTSFGRRLGLNYGDNGDLI